MFIDHLELKCKDLVNAVCLALDGATNLAWARPQSTMSNKDSLENLRAWMDEHQRIPKNIVADMAFTSGPLLRFYPHHKHSRCS